MRLLQLFEGFSHVLYIALGPKDAAAKERLFCDELKAMGRVERRVDGKGIRFLREGHEFFLHIRVCGDSAGIERLLQETHQGAVIGYHERLDWELKNLMWVRGYRLLEENKGGGGKPTPPHDTR